MCKDALCLTNGSCKDHDFSALSRYKYSVEEAPHVEYQVINILNEYKMHTFKFRTSTDSVHFMPLHCSRAQRLEISWETFEHDVQWTKSGTEININQAHFMHQVLHEMDSNLSLYPNNYKSK